MGVLCSVLVFCMQYFVPFITLQSPSWGKERESLLFDFNYLLAVMLLLLFLAFPSRCRGVVCHCVISWSYSLALLIYNALNNHHRILNKQKSKNLGQMYGWCNIYI